MADTNTANLKVKTKKPSPPSEEFLEVLCGHQSSSQINCEFCGRVYFSTDTADRNDFEQGEFEDLLRKSKKYPDEYISSSSSIYWGDLDGKQYVDGCPCYSASKYEKLFWNHRNLIGEYFLTKAKEMREEAERATDLAKKVSEVVKVLK